MTTDKYTEFPSLRIYDQLDVPYVLFSQPWDGPLWTGHCMMLSLADGYGDPGFFHELCHWIEASPTQRQYPDFALGRQVNSSVSSSFTSSTTPHYHEGDGSWSSGRTKSRNAGWGEKTVLRSEATRQEVNACTALWFYEPVVGLTSWEAPPADINGAAYDFNSVHNMPSTVNAKGMSKITRVLGLDYDDVKSYAALVRNHLRSEP